MSAVQRTRRVLVVAGLDPSGSAGLLADVEAVRARRAVALGAVSALTAQGKKTFRVTPVWAGVLTEQLQALLELGAPHAVKLGVVADARQLRALRRSLSGLRVPWVVDPVTRTSRGQSLSALRRSDYLSLAGPGVVLTPNLPELAWLLGQEHLRGEEQVVLGAKRLLNEGFAAVVVKGGHAHPSDLPTDFLVSPEGVVPLTGPWISRGAQNARGTGCRFAASLAAELAHGKSLRHAAKTAKAYVRGYLKTLA